MAEMMKEVCRKFVTEQYIHVKLVTRGGNKMSRELKSTPLRVWGCGRNGCMVCTTGGRGTAAGVGKGIGLLVWNAKKN